MISGKVNCSNIILELTKGYHSNINLPTARPVQTVYVDLDYESSSMFRLL